MKILSNLWNAIKGSKKKTETLAPDDIRRAASVKRQESMHLPPPDGKTWGATNGGEHMRSNPPIPEPLERFEVGEWYKMTHDENRHYTVKFGYTPPKNKTWNAFGWCIQEITDCYLERFKLWQPATPSEIQYVLDRCTPEQLAILDGIKPEKPYIVGVDGVGKIGEGEPWFDPRATLAMNEQNRQYYAAAIFMDKKSDKVFWALRVYGSGSAAFFARKTGLTTKEAGSVLSELKSKGKVTSEKCCREDGKLVNSYALK